MELNRVLQALENADKAGDKEAATELAQLAKSMLDAGELPSAAAPAAPAPRTGVGAALGKGIESTLSQMRSGLAGLISPEEAAKAGIERGKAIGQKYDEQVSLDKVLQAYKERGILPAAGEALSQIPAAIAEQLPNIGATVAGGRAGAALGSMAGPAGAIVGGLTGAALPSLIQQFGGNIERQAEEGVPVSRGKAFGAAVPQAALDVAGTFIPLGGRLVSKMTGIPEAALLKAGGTKIAEEKLAATLAKGTATGLLAEIPTEVAQQMLERAQAGLSLTDADAMREYGRTAYQVSLLAPMGTAGRLAERGAARNELARQQEEERQARMAEDMAKEKADREAAAQAKASAEAAARGEDLVQQAGITDKTGLTPEGQIAAAREELAQHEETLRQIKDVVPKLEARLLAAQKSGDLAAEARLSRQMADLEQQEAAALKGKRAAEKIAPPELDVAALQKELDKARNKNDYAKVAEWADKLAQAKTETQTQPGKNQPYVQEDMFAPGWEQKLVKQDIAEIEESFGKPPARAEKPSKTEAQQTALFDQQEELQGLLDEKELGKSFELTPEQYAEALKRGHTAPGMGAAPKVLYRQVTTPTGTRRVPYIVNEQGTASDITDTEAAKLEQQAREPEEIPATKMAVSEAIDSGLITPAVKQALGLTGLGRSVLDLQNPEDAAIAVEQLRAKLDEAKQQSQEVLARFVANPLEENNLYDAQGKLTEEAKDIIRRDVQAQEVERLLKHITDKQAEARTGLREDAAAKDLTKTLHRREAVSTDLKPIEQLSVEDKSELNQALGVTGEADLKAVPADRVSAMRHKLEARRQSVLKQEAYDKLLERLEALRTNKGGLHPYDTKMLAKLRADYVQAAINEAAQKRASEMRPALTTAEVLQASSEMHTALKELSTRYLAKGPTKAEISKEKQLTYKPGIEGTPVEDTTVSETGEFLYSEKYKELSDKGKKQKERIVGKLKSKQAALQRAITTLNNYNINFLEPARQRWQAMPEGKLDTPEHAAREAQQQKYLSVKAGAEKLAAKVKQLSDELISGLQNAGMPYATYGTIAQDVRSLEQRPFRNLPRALEVLQEHLGEISTRLLGEKKFRVQKVSPINAAQNLLDRIKEKEKQLANIKGKHGAAKAQEKLRDNIESLRKQYNDLLAKKGEAPAQVLKFEERRDEIESLQNTTKTLFEKGDYAAVAKALERLRQLNLDEQDANQIGAEIEAQGRKLERAIKDVQQRMDEIATGLKVEAPKEVKLGEKRVPPKVALSAEQLTEYKQLGKQLAQLETAYVQNKGAAESIGLYKGTVDTLTEDMFGTAPELGTIFETPEKFLGSAKYGKIAKLRKAARDVANTLPVSTSDVYGARTNYVAAVNVLEAVRKAGGKNVSLSQFYKLIEGEYLRQAEAVSKKRGGGDDPSKSGWAGREWYAKEHARLLELAKDAGRRSEFFLHTLTEQQADIVSDFNAAAKEVDIPTANGLVTAQAMVDRAKEAMDAMDERARRNGVIAPPKAEQVEDIVKTPEEKLKTSLAQAHTNIRQLKETAKTATLDSKAAIDAEIKGLYQHVNEIETELYMRTAEGRLKRMMDSFMEEFTSDVDPTQPLKTALGRATARSREYIPQVAKVHVDRIEQLREDRGAVIDAMAKLAKAAPPTNKQAFMDFNMDVAELHEKLEQIDANIEELSNKITEAQNAEVQFLIRADSAVKDAWSKVKAAEATIKSNDKKAFEALVKRKAALIEAEKLVKEARDSRVLRDKQQQQRIDSGFGLPGKRVAKVPALSEEGAKLAALSPDQTVATMNPGWSVTYTVDGPVFNYDPKADPEASASDKSKKALTANKAYDQLKKARNAHNKALDSKNATAIEATKAKLEEKQAQMEELAGARYIRVVQEIDADPIALDQEVAVREAVAALPAKDQKAYFQARAAQLAAKKDIEHLRSLKGETDLSIMQKAVRNISDAVSELKDKIRNTKSDYESDYITKAAYDKRMDTLTRQLENLEARKTEAESKLKPREATHEAKIKAATDAYFAAKKKADELITPKKAAETKAQRAPVAENVADMAATMRTLANQAKVGHDTKPLKKHDVSLRTESSEKRDARLNRAAEKMAKQDRLVTMYKQGTPEYNKALKETTKGYFNKLLDADNADGTVLRVEGNPPANPVDPVAAKEAADKYKAGLPKDVKFIYAPTMGEAPIKFLRALADGKIDLDTTAVKGGVLPDGTIVVIGNMHTDLRDLEQTLVHEAIGHYGVDMVLGPEGMKALVQSIRTSEGGIVGMAKALGVENDVIKTAMPYEQRARELEAAGDKGGAILKRREGEVQAVREMLAHLSERKVDESFVQKAGRWIKTLLGAIRAGLKKIGLLNTASLSTNDLYYTLFRASKRMQQELAGQYKSPVGLLSLRADEIVYANPGLAEAGRVSDSVIARERNWYDAVKANGSGLAFETSYVDRFAGFERLSRVMDELHGSQMMYYLRMYDERMHFVQQAVEHGAIQLVPKKRKDGRTEYLIEAVDGPSIRGAVNILKDAPAGSPEAASRLFTLYMSAIRARNKGVDVLNFSERITEADLERAVRAIEATPGLKQKFDLARKEYNDYNRNMIKFLRDTGAISDEVANDLVKEDDYIPWYRQRSGVVELVIGKESPIRIGSIAEQPYLQELVGGDKPIMDFLTSSVQNTNMLIEMGLRNVATRNAVFELQELGMARIGRKQAVGNNVVKFKVRPEDEKDTGERFAHIDGTREIPGDLLVKGMEGIPTQLTGVMRLMSKPATFLRKAVTAMPLYGAKQLFRDSTAAAILAGADFTPVMGALKEIGSPTKNVLERRGIVGGQIFTGTTEDLTRVLTRLMENKPGWLNSLAKWETIAMEADAATRRAQYNSYIKQGLSEMEATLMSLESMNFNKRGASPSMHVIGSMIPFFNAQIQGLNVLYKALTGKLPFNERLRIQEKLYTRGMMMAASTLAYSAMMQDDEAYKNANPDEKYGNWLVRIPGVSEPVRLPVPFEIGYIFKALPEALYNSAVNQHGDEEAVKAFTSILRATIPGGTSYGVPQAIKPLIEAKMGKSFYTGRDFLSAQEKGLLPEAQYRDNTSDAAKALGSMFGVSPIGLEELVRGYTSGLGVAFLQAISMGFPKGQTPEQAYKRLSDMPLIGSAFQPNDAGGIINSTYERMQELGKVQNTVDTLIERGHKAEAMALLAKRGNEYAASEVADFYTSGIRELTQYENAVRASNMTPQEKRAMLDNIRRLKINLATTVREAADRTKLP